MVGESSGVSTLLNSERISRENPAPIGDGQSGDQQENQERVVSDIATFSAEALALSRQVVAAGESAEQGSVESQGRGQEPEPGAAVPSIDIRV